MFAPVLSVRKGHVDPIVGRLVGSVRERVGGTVDADAVAAAGSAARRGQRPVGARIVKVVVIGGIKTGIGVIGGDVGGIGADRYRARKIRLLPATGGLVGRRRAS